jgi:hypothetical protein
MKKFVLFALIIISNTPFAQSLSGSIYGRVFDFTTKQPISFANILVLETNLGAATDAEGYFKIETIPVNTYQVKASVVGFNSQIKTDVVLQTAKPTEVNFELFLRLSSLKT